MEQKDFEKICKSLSKVMENALNEAKETKAVKPFLLCNYTPFVEFGTKTKNPSD